MRLLLVLIAKGALGASIWFVEPRSGSVLDARQTEQNVSIALELGDESATDVELCVAGKRLASEQEDGLGSGAFRWCVGMTIAANDSVLVSETTIKTPEPDGWYWIEVSLEKTSGRLSEFAVAAFVGRGPVATSQLGLAWDVGDSIGWGVAGLHVALALAEREVVAVPMGRVHGFDMTAEQRARLLPSLKAAASRVEPPSFPVVHALGRWGVNGSLGNMSVSTWSQTRNVGILFAETTAWSVDDLERLARFDGLLVGSTWCANALREAATNVTLPDIDVFLQGVDSRLFHPGTVVVTTSDRFRVFSGGKLEWRKGHDIVVAAFKAFQATHPNAQLVVAWTNPWRPTIETMRHARHTFGIPAAATAATTRLNSTLPLPASRQDHAAEARAIADWLALNGVSDAESLPALPHVKIPSVLRTVDVALFPNRVEGGTNLVAMEAAAMAVPTVLSANTGHLDVVRALGDNCWTLLNQTRVTITEDDGRVFDGFESDPLEAAAALAAVYADRTAARARARDGATRLRDWSWTTSVDTLLHAASPIYDDV